LEPASAGCALALRFDRKGWEVVIYEASHRIGGGLWENSGGYPAAGVLVDDLNIIEKLGITKSALNTSMGPDRRQWHSTSLARLCERV
jgi:2-polyprenyl-6-methoxyphenol hydroxylase-like FAD-dependent oxidoreductase